MKHIFRKLTVLLLVFAIILSMLPAVFAVTGTLRANSGTRDEVCTALSAKATAYYTGVYSYENLAALGGASSTSTSYNAMQNNPLYNALNYLMTATHTNQNVRYDGYANNSLATYWTKTDTENEGSTYLFFYTDILADDPSVSGMQMQREHVWPKSRASYYQKGGGSDLHHLRPSIGGVNASKSNNAFANLNGSGSAYSVNGQPVIWTGSKDGVGGVLEVRDNVKGDVARILLYIYVRWQQPNLYSDVASDLLPEMDPDDSQNTGGRAIESLTTLLQWMQKDPVDTWEMSRNDQIENVQGNRNVFIDYPELAYLMFSWPIPKMQTPSGKAMGDDPTTAPTEPTTAPTEPTTVSTDPTTAPTEPTTAPTEPTEVTAPHGDEYALTTTLKDGDEIVIFNAAAGKAMSEDAVANNYRAGVDATVLNNNIYTDNSKIVWTVGKTADGYTFTNDNGETLSATRGLSFAATDNVWAVNPAVTANSVYLVSTTAKGAGGDPMSVEWYGRYSEFSTFFYSDSLESDFAMQLFVKTGNVAPTEPTEPTTEPTTAPTEPTDPTESTEPTTAPTEPTEPISGDGYVLTSALKSGDQVIIYNPGNGKALTAEMSGYYLAGADVTPVSSVISNPNGAAVWTVTKNANGTYTFKSGTSELGADKSGTYTNIYVEAGHKNTWTLETCNAANHTFYVYNAALAATYEHVYLEWYGNKTAFSAYDTSADRVSEQNFGFQFYVKNGTTTPTEPTDPTESTEPTTAPTEPTDPTESTEPTTAPTEPTEPISGDGYVLTSALKSDDQVIIYNPGNGKALTAEMSGYYLAGADVTPVSSVISNPNGAAVWTVTKNANGTYTFKSGTSELGADKSGTYTNIYVEAGHKNTWTLETCNAANHTFYVYNAALAATYEHVYLEWYGNKTAFSAYDTSADRVSEQNFGFQFYVKNGTTTPTEPTDPTESTEPTTAPTEPTDPTESTEPTTAPTEPISGNYVAIFNPSTGKVMTTESYLYNNKKTEMCSADATLSGGKLTTSATNVALFELITKDGVTTFKTADGKYLEADGTNVQLVSAENENTKFVLEASGSDFFVRCNTAQYQGKAQYIELYRNYFTLYGMGSDTTIYTFNFYPLAGSTQPTEPTDPTESTEPTTAPTDPTTAPTEPTTAPTEPTTTPTEPTTAPTEPTTAPTEPTTAQIYYTITWYVDGKAYREQCAKGETPVFKGSTDKPADDEYVYTFAGWQPTPVPAYADATYVALYNKEPVHPEGVYLITWVVDGKKTTVQYEAGVMPVYTGSTDKPDDENYVYCFAGWSPAVEKVTKNATYTALYNRIPLHKVEDFVDVPKEMWCYDEVTRAAQLGLFNGMSYRHFEPNGNVSRAMIVTVLYRMEGEPEVKPGRTFSDVKDDLWYSDAVLWATSNGIAKGMSANIFAPNEPVTREQFAAFLYRYAEWKGYDVSGRGKLSPFADRASVSAYAEDALAWAVAGNMLRGMEQNGKLCLAPQGTATRAQAASIMVRFFNAFIK